MDNHHHKKNKKTGSNSRPPLPVRSEDPWLVYSHGKFNKERTQIFYSISEDRYHKKAIPAMSDNLICTCSHGWLVMMGLDDDDLNCFLLNPVNMKKIKLPQWREFGEGGGFRFCVLTSPPNIKPEDDNNCVVAFFGDKGPSVMFCRPGDNEWIVQELPFGNDYSETRIESAVTCGGKIYGLLGLEGKLVIIYCEPAAIRGIGSSSGGHNDNPKLTMRHLGTENYPQSLSYFESYENSCLVESCGDVFLVVKVFIHAEEAAWEYGKFKIPRVEVFKLDYEQLIWKKVTSLGDHRAFLLGQFNCLSCPSSSSFPSRESESEAGIKGNSIYFTMKGDRNLYTFDIEDGSISVSYLFREAVYNLSGPDWIVPICN